MLKSSNTDKSEGSTDDEIPNDIQQMSSIVFESYHEFDDEMS